MLTGLWKREKLVQSWLQSELTIIRSPGAQLHIQGQIPRIVILETQRLSEIPASQLGSRPT